jgi:hypothetical protein
MASKGKTAQRGYGARHQQLRKAWKRIVEAGEATCARCGTAISPDAEWDLGHSDDRLSYTGPEHRACNRATASHGLTRHSRVW